MLNVLVSGIYRLFHEILSKQFFNFILAGLCSASVSIVSRIIFQLEFSYFVSVLLASVTGMIVNFSINRKMVFRSSDEQVRSQFFKFLMIGSVSLILTPVIATLLLNFYETIHIVSISIPLAELLAHIGALIINSLYGYFVIKYFVFR